MYIYKFINNLYIMSKYKRLDACPKTFLIKYHNEAIDDAQLYVYEYSANNSTEYGYTLYAQGNMPGIRKDVYLGYEDANNIFEGKLSEAISNQGGNFQLDCNDDQCSGHFSFSGTDETTGAPIKYSLNKCTANRIITFSYKNKPIFKINQIYTAEDIYYTIYLWEINAPGGLGTFAFFKYDDNNPVEYSKNSNLFNKTMLYSSDISNTYQTALFCYSDDPILLSSTVSELISGGFVEHVQGHDYLISNQNKYNQLYIKQVTDVNVFSGGTIATDVTTTKATLGMTISIYQERTNGMYQTSDRIRFGNVDNTSHVGIYKIKK